MLRGLCWIPGSLPFLLFPAPPCSILHCALTSSPAVSAADLEPGSPLEVLELPSDEDGEGADAGEDSDEDADLDSHLAAAILAVEASAKQQRGGGSKFRLPKAFSLPGGGGGAQQQQRPASAGGEGGNLPSPGSEASSAAGLQRQRQGLDSSGGPASPHSPSLPAADLPPLPSPSSSAAATALQQHLQQQQQQQQQGAAPPSGQQQQQRQQHQHQLLSEADYVDYPYLVDGEPCPAAYLLLCCADYLRIYPTGE